MKFCIVRLNDNDEGTQFDTKEEFLAELAGYVGAKLVPDEEV